MAVLTSSYGVSPFYWWSIALHSFSSEIMAWIQQTWHQYNSHSNIYKSELVECLRKDLMNAPQAQTAVKLLCCTSFLWNHKICKI